MQQDERRLGYNDMHNDIKEIKEILVGKEGKNGLVGKVNQHENYIASQIKFAWAVVTSLLGALAVLVTGFFTFHKNNLN